MRITKVETPNFAVEKAKVLATISKIPKKNPCQQNPLFTYMVLSAPEDAKIVSSSAASTAKAGSLCP